MKLLSEREQVRAVSQEWKKSHRDPECRMRDGRTAGEIAARLDALDPETATAEDVFAAIGHRSWACQQTCDECGEYSWSCVKLGGLPDYLDCTATICEGCLLKAVVLIERGRFAAKSIRVSSDVVVFSSEIARGIDWNEVVWDWLAASGGSAGAVVTGTDLATGRDWTAVTDERVREGGVASGGAADPEPDPDGHDQSPSAPADGTP